MQKLLLTTLLCVSSTLLLFAHDTWAEDNGTEDFAVEINENGEGLILLGDELLTIAPDGYMSPMDKRELENQEIPYAAGMLAGPILQGVRWFIRPAIRWLWRNIHSIEFVKKLYRWAFPRKISVFEKTVIRKADIRVVGGKKVAKRSLKINMGRCGLSDSCSEMARGNAPFDHNCKKIQLHHVLQEDDGLILELTEAEHHENYSELHKHTNMSEIDREKFNQWKKNTYWPRRYNELCTR